VLVFVETQADKRSRMYKAADAAGHVVEFKTPTDKELTDWVVREAAKAGKKITPPTAAGLVRIVPNDMETIALELGKAADYAGQDEITMADVEAVCTRSLETRIFELVDAIGNKKPAVALEIYHNLLLMKESPLMILSMVARQFRLILQAKRCAAQNVPPSQIAERMGQRGFVASAALRQGQNFAMETVLEAVRDCLETDVGIKTGRIGDRLGVEILIIKYGMTSKEL